ncbi:hypothetical protein GR268_48685, partial [Rhizobium leguminosarum]|nr:hypothetical protein [Rhizobium leguminosarum]
VLVDARQGGDGSVAAARGLGMLVRVVPEVLQRSGRLMRAIASRFRPGPLDRQQSQQKEEQPAAHGRKL